MFMPDTKSARGWVHALARKFRRVPMSEWGLRHQRDKRHTDVLLLRVLRGNSNCLDIGAHKGSFLRVFCELAPEGTHYAFEPLPELAGQLGAAFPRVRVVNCALSNRTGTATFYHVPQREAWSGLQQQKYPDNARPVEIQVELKRVDDVVERDLRIDFIKIDVEGAELEVLQGAESTIKRCRPMVLFEHAKIHNENYRTTPDMIYDLLVGACGMEICDLALSRVFTKEAFLAIYESSFASNYDRHAETNFVARFPSQIG